MSTGFWNHKTFTQHPIPYCIYSIINCLHISRNVPWLGPNIPSACIRLAPKRYIMGYAEKVYSTSPHLRIPMATGCIHKIWQLEMLLIPNALCWSSRKCNCACALPAEVQLRLRVTRRSWQKLFAGKNFVKILVTAQKQLRSYSEQQWVFGNSNICNCLTSLLLEFYLNSYT